MFQRIKKNNHIKIIFLFLLASLGIFVLSDFQVKRNLRDVFFKSKVFLMKKNYENCQIKKIEKIPKESIVIIGHAYGSPTKKSDFISKKIQFFLKNNIQNINTIVFTGDVFQIPSKEKWNKLNNMYGKKSKILIAPGNHDIGFNNKNFKSFFNNSFSNNKFPYKVEFRNIAILVEDSTSNNWLFDKKVYKLIDQIDIFKQIVMVRHHVPIRELVFLANSKAGYYGGLPNFEELSDSINSQKDTIIIAGDSGAFSHLPRFICLKNKKLKVILNGIGDIQKDNIVVINKKGIFTFNLKNNFN